MMYVCVMYMCTFYKKLMKRLKEKIFFYLPIIMNTSSSSSFLLLPLTLTVVAIYSITKTYCFFLTDDYGFSDAHIKSRTWYTAHQHRI